MKEKLLKWAEAGDDDCMYKLAKIYQVEGNFEKYLEWLKKSAETKNFDAMRELAEILRNGDEKIRDYEKSISLYKELVKIFYDEKSMENIVDMCKQGQGVEKNDKVLLNRILEIIDEMYNGIYYIKNISFLARTFAFQTRRHNECTMEYLQAVERRRIAARIRKILAEN